MHFNSREEFEMFDLELIRKFKPLTNSGLIILGAKQYDFEKEKSYSIYFCRDCKTEWWLLEPHEYQRGFFVKKETGKRLISQLRPKTGIRPIIALGILIIIIGIIFLTL